MVVSPPNPFLCASSGGIGGIQYIDIHQCPHHCGEQQNYAAKRDDYVLYQSLRCGSSDLNEGPAGGHLEPEAKTQPYANKPARQVGQANRCEKSRRSRKYNLQDEKFVGYFQNKSHPNRKDNCRVSIVPIDYFLP